MKKNYETPYVLVSQVWNEQVICSSVGASIGDLQEDDTLNNLFN